MTVCGFAIAPGGNQAVAWADTELWTEHRPSGHEVKLFANVAAMVVGVCTGRVAILRGGDLKMLQARGLDDLVQSLPDALRESVSRCGKRISADDAAGTVYAVAGWSHRHGQLLGYVFAGSSAFVPMMTRAWQSPHASDTPIDGSADSVMSAACDQLEQLRQRLPEAKGGALTMATIGAGGIHLKQIYDFNAGTVPARPVNLAACG